MDPNKNRFSVEKVIDNLFLNFLFKNDIRQEVDS
jgi:hypothetical protein